MKMWTLFLFFSICIICFSAAGSSLAAAAIVYVDTDGTGDYNCDGTNDHIELNKALTYIDSIGGGTVYLRGPNTYWIDETLEIGSNIILTGDPSACIKLVPNAGWDIQVPLIKNINDVNTNITIKGFEIDGNSGSQSVSLGTEYYNMMYFVNCTDVTVTGMRLEWGTCDGLKIRNSPYNYTFEADIKFTDNSVYKLGHDALYVLGMNGVTVANNDVYTRTNSAFRLSSSGHAKIYNNVIHSELSSTSNGPGIEIDKSSGILSAHRSENIEIYNNLFHTLYGSAIWITGEDADNVVRGKDVYIHHNIMYNVGQYPIDTGYSNAAITIGQFNNTRIENNVIDNGGHAGIKYYRYINSYKMSSKFITTIKNNVITNCNKNVATGVWNYDSENHKFILNNNCIYKNTNSAYLGENIIHSADLYVDPLFVSPATRDYHLKSTLGHYSNGKWVVDTVSSPLIDAGCSTSAYSNEPFPNGGRINIGRYGNTAEASKSVPSTSPPPMVSYPPDYDNRLRESSPTTVLSTSAYIDIGKTTASYRDVMWFDLSGYKPTDAISKATLSFYWYYPVGTVRTSDTVVEVYRPVQWDPQYVTWNSRMSGTPWTTRGGNWFDKNGVAQGSTPYASVTFPSGTVPDNKYYEFDVTQLVQEYVSGLYTNTGLFLKAKTENGNYIAFYSSDWSNAAQRPALTVTTASASVDNPPVANAGSDKTATTGSVVTFTGSASTDDKGIVAYSWDFDASNGITSEANGITATKTYTTAGNYTVTLTVTDTIGQKSTDTLQVVVSSPTSSPAGTVSYTPVYDNRLRESSPTTVLSASAYIDIGKTTASYRDVMWFDLSGYKPTDTISKATLSLYWYYPAGATRTSDTVVEVYRPAAEWDPKYVSWNNRASGTAWSTAGGSWYDKNGVAQGNTPYVSLTFPASTVPGNKYYDFDVTQLVQEYVSGKYKNTGFFLKAKTENGNYIAFYSSDWSNAAQRPKLTVTIASASVDQLPFAHAGSDKTATIGSIVMFDGSASTDDKGIASYSWDFDASNGITSEANSITATKTYTTAGNYTVTLTVTDTIGQKSTDTLQVAVIGPTGTVSYTPVYDNRLRESSPTTVLSTSDYIDIGKTTASYRDVMLFDLSGYKTTDTISKATLSLYWYYPAGTARTSDTVVEVYRPEQWDPQYVTWNSRMSGILWSFAGGSWFDKNGIAQGSTPYASVTFPASTVPDNKYHDFDVTQLVQEYASGIYDNTGFFLKAKAENGNYIAFYSSDWPNTAQRPKLTVTTSAFVDTLPLADAVSDKTATTDY